MKTLFESDGGGGFDGFDGGGFYGPFSSGGGGNPGCAGGCLVNAIKLVLIFIAFFVIFMLMR